MAPSHELCRRLHAKNPVCPIPATGRQACGITEPPQAKRSAPTNAGSQGLHREEQEDPCSVALGVKKRVLRALLWRRASSIFTKERTAPIACDVRRSRIWNDVQLPNVGGKLRRYPLVLLAILA